MKALHIFCLSVFFLLSGKGSESFSQQAVFTLVPHTAAGGGWVFTQDSKGYMWFGGTGVHRYDGYSYKSYFNVPGDSASLAFDRIESIWADHNGFIWIGTTGMGLDRLDPETGIFTHYRHKSDDPKSLSHDSISVIREDREGKIWVGTQHNGLNCLDPKTGVVTRFNLTPNDNSSLSYDGVTALYEDRQGTIWVGTGYLWSPPATFVSKLGGLNRFNRATQNFTRFLNKPNDSTSLIDNRVRSIFEDSKGRFWVGTSGDGLHTMNREKGSFVRHCYDAADPTGLSRPPVRNIINWFDDMISFIREDAAGVIWIGTLSGGLNRYDPGTGKVRYYASLNEISTDNKDISMFFDSYVSKDGVFWISDWSNGIYRMDPFHKQIPQFNIGSMVRSLHQDRNGKLWLGTIRNGLIVTDADGMNKKEISSAFSNKLGLRGDNMFSIIEDKNGDIWIGTEKGLNRYNRQLNNFRFYPIKNGVNVIYEDSEGSFWLGTSKGLELMNRKHGMIINPLPNIDSTSILVQKGVSCIIEDKAGYLWLGSSEWGGLTRFDRKSNTLKPYLPHTSIQSIFKDAGDTLWIGTSKGLYYFNQANDSFLLFTNPGAGFPENISVYHILEDDQQYLWLNTSVGIFRLRHDRSEIIFVVKKDAAIPNIYEATQAGCFKGKEGELFFSNNNGKGYYAFLPKLLTGNTTKPELNITGFRLGDRLVYPGKGSPLNVSISQSKEIRLSYNEKVFSFNFAGIHYSNPEGNRHMYMLENLDNDWRKAGEEKTANYYNVPPGHYVFRVKAASSDGVWAEKIIDIIISPPWWKTWWAFCMYALLFIAAVVTVHRIQKKKVIEKEREKTREREQAQAKEIEKVYYDLQNTQAQLVQKEKMASLGELTAGIAHEIQNPLNFVNNFSEVNKEMLEELKTERLKPKAERDEQTEDEILNDVIANEEKINHHGKRADAIVKGMLQHSQASTGQKEPTNINKLAEEYLRLAYHGLRAKDKSFNAALKTDFDESIGDIPIVTQDIVRVILNLINNAFYTVAAKKKEYPNEYEPTISVSTKKIVDKVEIKVEDNGNGIPQKIVNKIFQPFFTTKPTGQGTGLGLSLSYDIIKAHGGELKVETKEYEGSTFIIILPIS